MLKAGDPLAPFFFFLIAVEDLTWLFKQAVRKNMIEEVRVGTNEVLITVLQFEFADDNLFLYEPKNQNILVIKSILRYFELVLGIKVNFHKY